MSAGTVTTTLELTEDLEARIAKAASGSGKSAYAFMLEAIEQHTELAERRRELVASALCAEEEIAQYGPVYDGDEVLSWFQSRLEGGVATWHSTATAPSPTQRLSSRSGASGR